MQRHRYLQSCDNTPHLLLFEKPFMDSCDSKQVKTASEQVSLQANKSTANGRFTPGQLLAGRFRVLKFLAQGGMGEVYEAEDLELRERVAIKTVRPDLLQDPQALPRFKREIHLARKVTHPNVCRIFDVFRDEGAGGEVVFVSMELLVGDTLDERLRCGPMALEAALPIIEQMAAGLSAAHERGIVHGDFKPSNVVLETENKVVRAVVTDFGLAFRVPSDNTLSTQFLMGEKGLGTPAYMSPEQVQGAEITRASDIYSLGLVIYEMVTGRRPFEGDTPFAAAMRRLRDAPPAPRQFVPDLPMQWEAVILRCLELNPARRFDRARDVADALTSPVTAKVTGGRASRGRNKFGPLAFIAAVVIAASVLWFFARRPVAITPTAMASGRRSVAVLGFKNLSQNRDSDWISSALTEELTTELAVSGTIRTIPGEDVARARADLAIPDDESLGRDTLVRLHRNLGSDLVLLGGYLQNGDQLRLDLRLQDTRSAETVASASVAGTQTDLPDLVMRAGTQLRSKLGVPQQNEARDLVVHAIAPANPDAARWYTEGVSQLRAFDLLTARDLLTKAVRAEPSFALSHGALAQAFSELGYTVKAQQEAKSAWELANNLGKEQQLWSEGQYRELSGDYRTASEVYRVLFASYPDNLEYGLKLASTIARSGSASDAFRMLNELRQHLPTPQNQDARIDLLEADVAQTVQDPQREGAAAERAYQKASEIGATEMMARALKHRSFAQYMLGDLKAATDAGEEARQLFEKEGDLVGEGRVVANRSSIRKTQGQASAAEQDLISARKLFQRAGNQLLSAQVDYALASLHADTGRGDDARQFLIRAVSLFTELGEKNSCANSLVLLGRTDLGFGHLDDSERELKRGLQMYREAGNQGGSGYALYDLGWLYTDRGDLIKARRAYEESIAINEALKKEVELAETRIMMATVFIEEGRAADAEPSVREALTYFHQQNRAADELDASATLASLLLAQGRAAEAERTINNETSLLKTANVGARVNFQLVAAQVAAANGRTQEAQRELTAVLAEAKKYHAVEHELEARLALGELALLAHPSLARIELSALEQAARHKGFLLIAKKAAALRARVGTRNLRS